MIIRKVFLICFLLISFNTLSQYSEGFLQIREEFKSIETSKDAMAFLELDLSDLRQEEQILARAYKGTVSCMMAEMVSSPFKKLKYFNKGKSLIEESIASDQLLENTYLRLLVQLKSPAILNYNGMIAADVDYFQSSLNESAINANWKSFMVCSLMAASEDAVLKERLGQLKSNLR